MPRRPNGLKTTYKRAYSSITISKSYLLDKNVFEYKSITAPEMSPLYLAINQCRKQATRNSLNLPHTTSHLKVSATPPQLSCQVERLVTGKMLK